MKYINLFDTQAAYDAAEKYYPNVSYIEATDEVVYQENDPGPDYSKEYLTFEALESGTFSFYSPAVIDSTKMTSVSYSLDNGNTWVDTTIDNTDQTITTPTINAGDKVLWKGVGTALNKIGNNLPIFRSTANCNVSGNIMSMLYGDNFIGQTTLTASYAFYALFRTFYDYRTKIVSAGNLILPATTLANYCYSSMFNGCTSLTTAPELPATTLAISCYSSMFQGCTSLTTAPVLPATTLANSCYSSMFNGCTSLTTAPELPATTLVIECYFILFQGCRSLNRIKMLATEGINNQNLNSWVNGVAATGIFVKAASATIPTGSNGIPSGWTVEDA